MGSSIRPLRLVAAAAVAFSLTATLAACSDSRQDPPAPAHLVLVTHDSFALSDGVLDAFTAETGVTVEVQALGDAGALVNKLVLTKDSPLGDVVFGIDNTFASRAVDVLEPYVSGALTDAEAPFLLPADQGGDRLTPIDSGDVCVNVDHEWFQEQGLAEPATLEDLADPAYRDLLVVESAGTSSPGLAFLLATIAAFGDDGWQDYWRALVANGVSVAAGWTDAYYAEFSGPSSEGDRPLVVSYSSSPPVEIVDAGAPTPTGVLEATCFRQTEFAGVLAGTRHPAEARLLVDFLLTPTVQSDIPGSMYVYPVVQSTALPETWAAAAVRIDAPFELDPARIGANRERWIEEWSAIAVP
ncbi:MAG TPA: thiamine ABC transporter substrate-binding protein [Microbacteriaceae bacterium]|nr:thiamine ABC transporter substrate-binding protein [Microbacteriaceae bacterium]